MANVIIGSARIDERGNTTGGLAGDQTGNEVSTQNWYLHSNGWRVFRSNDSTARDKIAKCMQMSCDNNRIGYDQNQRNTLYNAAKPYGFDTSKVSSPVETDCSALVRVCCAYAGISLGDFNTSTEASTLKNSGRFTELTDSKYTSQSAYLMRGDILVTKTKGHTVVVLSNGSKAGASIPTISYKLGDRILKNGMEGADVKELQTYLIQLGYSCGSWGADGEFGDATEIAVRNFQKHNGCGVDGEVGNETLSALMSALGVGDGIGYGNEVKIVGGQCWVRSAPNTSGKQLGIALEGQVLQYGGQQSVDGWLLVAFDNQNGWVSGKYGKLIN